MAAVGLPDRPLAMPRLDAAGDAPRARAWPSAGNACSEDLEVFHELCGVAQARFFDTQNGAPYLGMDFSMGIRGLVKGRC